MTRLGRWLLGAVIIAVLAMSAVPQAQNGDATLLRQAQELEKAKGDRRAALVLYEKLAKSRDPKVATEARQSVQRLTPPVPAIAKDGFSSEVVTAPAGDASGGRTLSRGRKLFVRQLESPQRRQSALDVREPGGSEYRLLTLGGAIRDYDIAVSPTGDHVAVISIAPVPAASPTAYAETLTVIGVASGTKPLLSVNWRPPSASPNVLNAFRPLLKWSPDGQALPFLEPASDPGQFDVKLLTTAIPAVRALGVRVDGPPDFNWSPDGQELAIFGTDATGNVETFQIVSRSGGATRSVPVPVQPSSSGARTRLAGWTEHAGLVLMASPDRPFGSELWLVDPLSKASKKVCSGQTLTLVSARRDVSLRADGSDYCQDLTNDGRRLLVWRQDSKRYVLRDTATSVDTPLSSGSGEEHAAHLSPDGKFVLFLSNRDGRWGLYGVLLDRIPSAAPVLVHRLDDRPAGLALSWTGDVMTAHISYDQTNVVKVPLDPRSAAVTGPLERLTQDSNANRGPAISPDGSMIAYWSNRSQFGLTIMSADGANERQVTAQPFPRWHATPIWTSPTEVVVEVLALSEHARPGYRAVDVGDGTSKPASVPASDLSGGVDHVNGLAPVAVPARHGLAYVTRTEAGQTLRLRSWLDGTESTLATFGSRPIGAFAVSRDGAMVAFSRYTADERCPCEFGLVSTRDNTLRVIETTQAFQMPVAFSPDNRFLLYGPARPRILDIASATSRPLMSDPVQQPLWSQEGSWAPDGSYIAITVGSSRSEARRWQTVSTESIRAASAKQASGEAVRLWSSDALQLEDVSRDGAIALARAFSVDSTGLGQQRVVVRRLATNADTTIAQSDLAHGITSSSLSPDGSHVAYVWAPRDGRGYRSNAASIRIVALATGQPRTVVTADGSGGEISGVVGWTPSSLLYLSREVAGPALVAAPLTGGTRRVVRTFPRTINPVNVQVSPDGKWLGYLNGLTMRLHVMSEDGARDAEVVKWPVGLSGPVWAPDGGAVFFTSSRSGSEDLYSAGLRNGESLGEPVLVRRRFSGRLRRFTAAGVLHYAVAEGQTTVFVADRQPRGISVAQTFNGSVPTISPDGRSVLFHTGPGRLIVRTVASGEERTFELAGVGAGTGGGYLHGRWLPDSQGIVTWVTDQGDGGRPGGGFYLLDLRTGTFKRLFSRRSDQMQFSRAFAISSDGQTMYLLAMITGQSDVTTIAHVELATGTVRRTTQIEAGGVPSNASVFALALTNDDRMIAIQYALAGASEMRIRTAPVAGGVGRELPPYRSGTMPDRLAWTPDGRFLLAGVVADGVWRVMRISAENGAMEGDGVDLARVSPTAPSPLNQSAGSHGGISKDGTRIVFEAAAKPIFEAWSLRGILR